MANTAETAIVFAIIMVAISLFLTEFNDLSQTNEGKTLVSLDSNSSLSFLVIDETDLNEMNTSFQSLETLSGKNIIQQAATILSAATTMLSFGAQSLLQSTFGWVVYLNYSLNGVGLGGFIPFLSYPLIAIQVFGLLQLAFLFKRLIPFGG